MKVKYIKDHPCGVKKGTEANYNTATAQKLVNQGYIEADGLKSIAKKEIAEKECVDCGDQKKSDSKKKITLK